jgi:hypothetical protein
MNRNHDDSTELDEYLHHLITRLQNMKPGTIEWQKTMNRLLSILQRQPAFRKYCRDGSPENLLSGLNRIWEWLSSPTTIQTFKLPATPPGTWKALKSRINGHLYWRVKDELRTFYHEINKEFHLDCPTGHEDDIQIQTWLDRVSADRKIIGSRYNPPTLKGIEDYIQKEQEKEQQRFVLKLELYIEEDPEERLRNCHLLNKPDCHAQVVVQRLFFKTPKPDTRTAIAKDFGVIPQTFFSFCTLRVIPLLKDIINELTTQCGYPLNEEP